MRRDIWAEIKRDNFNRWKEQQLPLWTDPKFISQDNIFYYPYFDGPSRLGFTIAIFNDGISEDESKKIEVFSEAARGVFLDFSSNEQFLETKRLENTSPIKRAVEKVTSFFKKLFG